MKYLVITEKDSMLLTEEELRQCVVSGEIHKFNCRVFSVNIGEQRLHSVTVRKWPQNIPWVDIYDIFGNRIDTLKPKGDCK